MYLEKALISAIIASVRKGVRVVDGNGLENRRAGNGTVGSNPTPSATGHFTL
jgi:hypothetical protein